MLKGTILNLEKYFCSFCLLKNIKRQTFATQNCRTSNMVGQRWSDNSLTNGICIIVICTIHPGTLWQVLDKIKSLNFKFSKNKIIETK